MFVEFVSETLEPGGDVKIVVERHCFGSEKYLLKRRLTRSVDGSWAMIPADARLFQRAQAHGKCLARGLPTPKQIRELRKSLGLSQRQASRLFGSGPRSFQKYESGAEVVGTAMAHLLWLVRQQPELVSELATADQWKA